MTVVGMLMAERARLYRSAIPHGAYLDFIRDNKLGVKSLADPDPFEDCGVLAVTTIRPTPDGSFDFVHHAEPKVTVAAVIEAYGADRQTTEDIVAWPVADPFRVRRQFGRCDMLGAWNVTSAASTVMDTPLLVHRTPLGWLQAGCRGVVLLDPPSAVRRLLDAPGRISGEDRQHSQELADAMVRLVERVRIVAPVSSDLRKAA